MARKRGSVDPAVTRFLERNLPILIGVCLILFGLGFGVASAFATSATSSAWWPGLLSNLAVGLIAAGIINATLEPLGRRRVQDDVKRMEDAHAEAILKTLMPEFVFREVVTHIIRQPFNRIHHEVDIRLTWLDASRQWLRKVQTIRYRLRNASRTLVTCQIRVSEERIHDSQFPNCTKVAEVTIHNTANGTGETYKDAKLSKFAVPIPQHARVVIPVELESEQEIDVYAAVEAVHSAREVYPSVVNMPSDGLTLTVDYPEGLAVTASPLHPSQAAFRAYGDDALKRKTWRIDAGLLPFQGIQVSWQPIESRPPSPA